MHIVIRTDANREIAMGHVMRCLSVGEALKKQGAEVSFVTAGEEAKEIIQSRGFSHTALHTDFSYMEEELPAFFALLQKRAADLILVDSYFVTFAYMKALYNRTRLAYMDDMGERAYPADVLINYNNYGTEIPYEALYRKANLKTPELLTGCAYAPLREEFQRGVRSRRSETVRDVLISTGGGDRTGMARKLCERLLEEKQRGMHKEVTYHIVCGPFYSGLEELRQLANGQRDVQIHTNVTKMSELMQNCDIALSAAGGTMYELCSMALPTVCFVFAENQRQMAECFHRTTEIRNAGNVEEAEEEALKRLLERLEELEKDKGLRDRIRKQMEQLTDGRGAWRIGRELLMASGKKDEETGRKL